MIDLFKAYLADVESVGSRYSAANSFYMTVVSALLGVLAFTESAKPLSSVGGETAVTIAVFAVIICWIWRKTIDFYRGLFFAKFTVLRAMESQLAFPVFATEDKILKKGKVESLLKNERRVPELLAVFFIVLILLALGKALIKSCG